MIKMMIKANELATMYQADGEFEDRCLFVRNLGWLLSQTRNNIISCELDMDNIVTVTYQGGNTKKINVRMDSYMAIIRDVAKQA